MYNKIMNYYNKNLDSQKGYYFVVLYEHKNSNIIVYGEMLVFRGENQFFSYNKKAENTIIFEIYLY